LPAPIRILLDTTDISSCDQLQSCKRHRIKDLVTVGTQQAPPRSFLTLTQYGSPSKLVPKFQVSSVPYRQFNFGQSLQPRFSRCFGRQNAWDQGRDSDSPRSIIQFYTCHFHRLHCPHNWSPSEWRNWRVEACLQVWV